MVERVAPGAWFINFTNPAGLITQALTQNTALQGDGHLRHARANCSIRSPKPSARLFADVACDYAGLNHLGWVRRVHLRGEDITDRLLDDTTLLRGLYPAGLFDPALIQTLRLIPTEYLFFYYSQRKAYRNQVQAGASRGEELQRMNSGLFERLGAQTDSEALATYRAYLQQRNASYMKLEGQAVRHSLRSRMNPIRSSRYGIPPHRARRDERPVVRSVRARSSSTC